MKLIIEFETKSDLARQVTELYEQILGQNTIKVEPDRSAVNKIKDKIKERDGNCCVLCNSDFPLVVHHIFNFKEYPDLRTEESNLVTLCEPHHKELHSEFGKNTTLNEFEAFINGEYEYKEELMSKVNEYEIDFKDTFQSNEINKKIILNWLSDNDFTYSGRETHYIVFSELYENYKQWCIETGVIVICENVFGKILKDIRFNLVKKVINYKQYTVVTGICKLENF